MEYDDLELDDYKNILTFYNIKIPRNHLKLKKRAEKIMAQKLCGCIKKVSKRMGKGEGPAIGICTKSIFNDKDITRKNFKCKKSLMKVTMKKRKNTTSKKVIKNKSRRSPR
jgi:hypothetical protein